MPVIRTFDVLVKVSLEGITLAAAKQAVAETLEDDDSRREPGVAFIRSQAGTLISLIPGITDYDIVTPSANIQPVIDATKVEWLRLGNVEVELL